MGWGGASQQPQLNKISKKKQTKGGWESLSSQERYVYFLEPHTASSNLKFLKYEFFITEKNDYD